MAEQHHLNNPANEMWMNHVITLKKFHVYALTSNVNTCGLSRMVTKDVGCRWRARFQSGVALQESKSGELLSLEEVLVSMELSTAMQLSSQNLISICQRCKKEKNLAYAKCIHMHIRDKGLESHEELGNYVVQMFVECGSLPDAQHVFDSLAHRNEYSWISLLKAHFDQGELQHVLHLCEKMQEDGILHNRYTIVTPLKACARLNRVEKGRDLHSDIYKQGLENDLVIGNTLVDMYAKCGSIEEATGVFEKLQSRDVVSWNALMTGYVEHGFIEKALNCLHEMSFHGVAADKVTLLCCLKACGNLDYVDRGHDTHAAIVKQGLERHLFLGNALIDMYTKCGSLTEAREVLEQLPIRDVISWTSLIAGYAENGCGKEALKCLERMQEDGISPTAATLICSLKACGSMGSIEKGREIHDDIPIELYRREPTIGNSLVDMYAKCGSLVEAQQVFDQLPNRNLISWNTLIAGYTEHGRGDDALNHFEKMQLEGMCPDTSTLNCSLKACGLVGSLVRSQEVHADIVKKGLEKSHFIGNTLVDVYAKCGSLADAQQVFDKQNIGNVVSWTALISGYADRGLGRQALDCLEKMQMEGVPRNAVTMACSLKACSSIGAIDVGQELHTEVTKTGYLYFEFGENSDRSVHKGNAKETDRLLLGNALIDMYGKCGNVLDAQNVFDAMPLHDLVSWNALITGYARQGHNEVVMDLFDKMREEVIDPDAITFLSLLSACNHAGLVFKARTYFDAMTKEYNVPPTSEHYNCVIDLLGRAGQLVEAIEMLEKMPFQPTIFAWCSMLGACRKWGNVKLGRHAFECVMRLDKQHAAAFILMFNIYMDACMWEEAKKMEAMIQALMEPGQAWVEIGGIVHTFNEDDIDNIQYGELHTKLRHVYAEMEEKGYDRVLPETLDADATGDLLCKHSEKLAVACALLSTSEGTQIRIVKNLRICEDCHVTMAFVSKMEKRNIICKDKICFHDFKNGICSCGDYW